LVGAEGPVPLPPKAFDLLVILATNAGRLLRKEDLMNRLWPGVFVEEVNLAQNVSAVRRALGGRDRQEYIQTVAGAGYRFVAPVTAQPDASAGPPSTASDGGPARPLLLPFRVLTPNAALEFLAFSLPDAISGSLSNLTT